MESRAQEPGRPIVSLEHVSKVFVGENTIVQAILDVSLTVERNSFVSIVGPSGCGKSTLLHLIAGLSSATAGRVLYAGTPIVKVNTKVGYVTQHDNLLPWRNVSANIGLGLELDPLRRSMRQDRVAALIDLMKLKGFENAYPKELSGGMRKRVALARAFAYDPETLLMDEPFAALDALMRFVLQDELMQLWTRNPKTVLFVTHDLQEAILLSDYVVVMTQRPSTIKAIREVPIRRPRILEEDRFTPAFHELYAELWDMLQVEIQSS